MGLRHSATRAEPDIFHRLLTTFGGIQAGQTWCDYLLWEMILNAHASVRAIVEIGTWQGGFSRYLHAQAEVRGLSFRTYDAVPPAVPPPGFQRVDVFAHPEEVVAHLQWCEPFVLLCDGGNKARELRLFAPNVKEDSIVVVHDWLTEIHPADVPAGLQEVYGDFCDSIGSMSRVFQAAQ